MSISHNYLSTGLPELDKILKGLIPGDNIVWQVRSIDNYAIFVKKFAEHAVAHGQKLVYFRFADHDELISEDTSCERHVLNPEAGFEMFINSIHAVIEKNGKGGFYVFDCLTYLAYTWFSDQMLGNFFKLTCPYLLDIEALAYFSILSNQHSNDALLPISETTQIFIDIYKHEGGIYIHPIKVQQRYSPTMYMLHSWNNGEMLPVTKSAINSEIFTSISWSEREPMSRHFDIWHKMIIEAEYVNRNVCDIGGDNAQCADLFRKLLRMIITREEKLAYLAEKFLTIDDILGVSRRMIGTGLIGGKSVGLLLSRAILKRNYAKWAEINEVHDSFFIGSDVFYSYLVSNGCWWVRQQKDIEDYLHNAMHARRLILTGKFPQPIIDQFNDMLNYFGQSPIIVRSSSLLEDNFGNAFSGKYVSVFCPNQGPRGKCLEDFMTAVRTIYASTMSEEALRYRNHSGMLSKDEQMSLLVQRVSGSLNDNLFYPFVAGVGYSFNPFAWSEYIDPHSGVIRLVFGLGTRAVDRSDDDYTRLAALNAPQRRPEENIAGIRKYSQKKVDVIDLEANQLKSLPYEDVLPKLPAKLIDIVASYDLEAEERARQYNMSGFFSGIITFENLFEKTPFVSDMKEILKILQEAYEYPVDIEFTTNFIDDVHYKINIVQCRPFEVKGGGLIGDLDETVDRDRIILKCGGPVIGESREAKIDRIIYVEPSVYGNLPERQRYAVARLIGKLTNYVDYKGIKNILLIGPGRWGTTTPSLGVPVSLPEIHSVSFLCEIVAMRDDLIPDVSLGTHFFNDIVELNMLYTAVYPHREDTIINWDFFKNTPAKNFPDIDADDGEYKNAVRVIDIDETDGMYIYANSIKQQVMLYRK
jgi:pyruvate,water dikinase